MRASRTRGTFVALLIAGVCAAVISACSGGSGKTPTPNNPTLGASTEAVGSAATASTAGTTTPLANPSAVASAGATIATADDRTTMEIVPVGAQRVPFDPQSTYEFEVVAKHVPAPGFTIYHAVIDYDETVVDMIEVDDAALADSNPKPLCVALSDTDYNSDGNLMAEIICGVPGASDPQKPDDSKAKMGDVVLAKLKFKPLKQGTSPLKFVDGELQTAEKKRLKFDFGQGYSVEVGGNP